jgi:hypothetical protein
MAGTAKKPTNIYKRILKARDQVPFLKKEGFNNYGKFCFVTHDRVSKEVGDALAGAGICPVISVVNTQFDGQRVDLDLAIQLVNVDDPEDKVTGIFSGRSMDKSDKGPLIALSLAKKAGLLALLLIPTGDAEDEHAMGNGKTTAKKAPAPRRAPQEEADPEPRMTKRTVKREAPAPSKKPQYDDDPSKFDDKPFMYKTPFELKDECKARHGWWDGDTKTWRFREPQPDWQQYLLEPEGEEEEVEVEEEEQYPDPRDAETDTADDDEEVPF